VINAAKKEFGVLVLPLPTHIEVPSTKLLIQLLEKGLFIAKIESEAGSKVNYLLVATQKEGAQGISKCEGGEKESLLAKVDEKEEAEAGLGATFLIEFDKTIDANGEEIE